MSKHDNESLWIGLGKEFQPDVRSAFHQYVYDKEELLV